MGVRNPLTGLPSGASAGSNLVATDVTGLEWNPDVQIGMLDCVGDSHISEYGPSVVDFGIAHKIVGLLRPSLFRTCAAGGQLHSWANQGNGAAGDGGWASIATEFDRQEQSSNRYNSTITQTQASGVSSYTVASVTNGAAPTTGEWVVLGVGANTEVIQIAQNWGGASPITFVTPTTKSHTSADPIYHACRNEGFLAKSEIVLMAAEGLNDLGALGPGAPPSPLSSTWMQGTFGATLGASRGMTPFMHALRFSIAGLRCSVIYKDTHPSCVYTGTWTSTAQTSTASYPTLFCFGGNTGNYHTTASSGDTVSFSTEPDFSGGTVVAFVSGFTTGQGAIWDYSVSGATTIALTSHGAGTVYDTRNVNPVVMNKANTAGSVAGSCIRITGLNAGVNTITLKATTVTTITLFLGWGIEAPIPPLILALQSSRLLGSSGLAGPGASYNTRTRAATGATVTAGHGAAAGEVTFTGGTVALATIGTPSATAAQINDTLTLDKGNPTEETRRIVGFTSSPATACQVDANFVNAHTAAPIALGQQDADVVGGGYHNVADTQGALSVPGLAAVIASVVAEFDSSVVTVALDQILFGGAGTAIDPLVFWNDGVHYNDKASGAMAAAIVQVILAHPTSISRMASPAVPNKRTFIPVYGDTGASPATSGINVAFANSWTNVFSSTTIASAATYPRTGFSKDPRTREVEVRGAVTGGASGNTIMFTLPVGYWPAGIRMLPSYAVEEDGTYGIAVVTVGATGQVTCVSGWPGAAGFIIFGGTYLAEA